MTPPVCIGVDLKSHPLLDRRVHMREDKCLGLGLPTMNLIGTVYSCRRSTFQQSQEFSGRCFFTGLWAVLAGEDVRTVPDVFLLQAEREPDGLKVDTYRGFDCAEPGPWQNAKSWTLPHVWRALVL